MAKFWHFFIFCAIISVCVTLPFEDHNVQVTGGTPAEAGQFPSLVSIRIAATNKHYCTGTIISDSWVVSTASSQVLDGQPDHFNIVAGSNDLTQGGTPYNISVVKMYPTYAILKGTDNIALLKIQGTFEITDLVQIADMGGVAENDTAIVAGWGRDYTLLQFASETVLSNAECNRQIIESQNFGHVCADGGTGVGVWSVADWGAPMMVGGKLAGVAYDGTQGRGWTDLFMNVSNYLDWINQSIV